MVEPCTTMGMAAIGTNRSLASAVRSVGAERGGSTSVRLGRPKGGPDATHWDYTHRPLATDLCAQMSPARLAGAGVARARRHRAAGLAPESLFNAGRAVRGRWVYTPPGRLAGVSGGEGAGGFLPHPALHPCRRRPGGREGAGGFLPHPVLPSPRRPDRESGTAGTGGRRARRRRHRGRRCSTG